MSDSPLRWKVNGLPRKGWELYDVVDMDYPSQNCEWCDTTIRYVHYLIHHQEDLKTSCGCICAEHLTEDYINPKKREKELKSIALKKKRKILAEKKEEQLRIEREKYYRDTYHLLFKKSKNGNFYLKTPTYGLIIIFIKNERYKVKIGDLWWVKSYSGFKEATISVYDYINK